MTPKFPDITVQITDQDGNVFNVIGRVIRAMREAGVAQAEIDAFREEALSGDYDKALRTCMEWVNVD